ncbi:LPXTG cell wall anchor domain-containing protein [Jannaschia helgolandensis]
MAGHETGETTMNSIFYIIGVVVVALAVISFIA